MLVPPVNAGAVKFTVTWAFPALAVTAVGAPGTEAVTAKLCVTVVAERNALLPDWLALMMQVPGVRKLSVPLEVMVHTLGVLEEKLTDRPEVAVALSVGVVPKLCAPGLEKVMVWLPTGVTLLEADEAAPVPALLVAVTVNV